MTNPFQEIMDKLDELEMKMDLALQPVQTDEVRLLSLTELIEYLPEKPARQTVYGWTDQKKIPYEKHGSRLYFRKSKIDSWLSNGRQMKGGAL